MPRSLGYAAAVVQEFVPPMSQPPPPHRPASLRWITCSSEQLESTQWLNQVRRAAGQVVLTPWALWRSSPSRVEPWAARVRQQQLVAGITVPIAAIADLPLAELDAGGPLLIVIVAAEADDRHHWNAARATLARSRLAKLRWTSLSVPTCHLGDWQPDVVLAPLPPRSLPQMCAECGARSTCAGPLPDQQIAPLPDPVSNQFDLTDAAADTAMLTLQGEPPRHFALRQAMSPLVSAALASGQLYLDRSEKARLDDFAADLALLLPQTDGSWRVADLQPFAAEEALLLGHLRELRGVVVDIGAGPIRYVQQLAQAQAAGQLRYVAVEPELAALERTVTVLPDALCLQGTGEHLPLADASADAVLMLRSYNHLRDVPQALREVARVLKPGGVFLACDNVAFGLCRSPEQLARAHAIPVTATPFEHYRNADAADAAAALLAAVPDGFQIEALQSVGPGTSNQWFLRAKRVVA